MHHFDKTYEMLIKQNIFSLMMSYKKKRGNRQRKR